MHRLRIKRGGKSPAFQTQGRKKQKKIDLKQYTQWEKDDKLTNKDEGEKV